MCGKFNWKPLVHWNIFLQSLTPYIWFVSCMADKKRPVTRLKWLKTYCPKRVQCCYFRHNPISSLRVFAKMDGRNEEQHRIVFNDVLSFCGTHGDFFTKGYNSFLLSSFFPLLLTLHSFLYFLYKIIHKAALKYKFRLVVLAHVLSRVMSRAFTMTLFFEICWSCFLYFLYFSKFIYFIDLSFETHF